MVIINKSAMIGLIAILTLPGVLHGCERTQQAAQETAVAVADRAPEPEEGNDMSSEDVKNDIQKVVKSDTEWRKELTPEQYHVTRQAGTERAFTGALYNTKEPGSYLCVCCGNELFNSDTKYDSGSGWPSFWAPVDKAHVAEESDRSLGMLRTEVKCSRCDAHLGHVFEDGPDPTGRRYCINSAALKFRVEDSSDEE